MRTSYLCIYKVFVNYRIAKYQDLCVTKLNKMRKIGGFALFYKKEQKKGGVVKQPRPSLKTVTCDYD